MNQLCREADGVTRDGALALDIEFTAGERRRDHLKPELRKESVPERKEFVHIQAHWNANFSARALLWLVVEQSIQFKGVHVQFIAGRALCNGFFTAVPADEASVPTKNIDGKATVVAAQTTVGNLDLMLKVFQLLQGDDSTFTWVLFSWRTKRHRKHPSNRRYPDG